MKNHLSTAIIATALALLVPNNGAEAVGTVTGMMARSASVQTASLASFPQEISANVASASSSGAPDPSYAWIMALGFLGFVVTRRLRGD
jgi:hypothetical protein